jgi:hypothetical protein
VTEVDSTEVGSGDVVIIVVIIVGICAASILWCIMSLYANIPTSAVYFVTDSVNYDETRSEWKVEAYKWISEDKEWELAYLWVEDFKDLKSLPPGHYEIQTIKFGYRIRRTYPLSEAEIALLSLTPPPVN